MAFNGWSVDPAGVERVLTAVATKATALTDALGGSADGSKPGVAATVEAAASAAQSQVIGEALAQFFEHQQPTLTGIQNRIQASLLGAAGATRAIDHGDAEMASTTQANAIDAAKSGNFAAFDGAPGN